jgi:acyl-CoA synthetase (AMP-forming)/AMP-acid ligase II
VPPVNPLARADLLVRRNATLGTIMDRLAQIHGRRRLVEETEGGIRCSYEQAAKRVSRWAGGIRASAEPGDRVVIATPNTYELFLLCLAASKAGCIPVPVNSQMRPDEVRHVIADSGAKLVIRAVGQVDQGVPLRDAYPTNPGDVAALFYTSGTTGKPKGVELTHRALLGQLTLAALWPARFRHDEAVISLPIAHIMGFVSLLVLGVAGIPVYFLPHFRPDDVLKAIETRGATIFIGVPTMYRLMLEAGAEDRDLSSVRMWGSGADVMPPELAERFKKLGKTVHLPFVGSFGEAIFAEGYGMVELGGGIAAKISPPLVHLGLGESLGFPFPGYHLRVVDENGDDVQNGEIGELWVKGPGVLRGYWNSPEATSEVFGEDGWLRTGDLARRGPMHSLVFVGRHKDVIIRGGFNVYSNEVQAALEAHPDVLEAAVTGVADERLGEVPVAAVRVRPGSSLTGDALREWVADRIAEYKVPTRITIVDELPRTGTRKVQKNEVRSLFES